MDETKLTVRVSRKLLSRAKRFAAQNNTSLTKLIEAYLQHLPDQTEMNGPIVQRLTGILSSEISVEDYRKHMEEKYGR